MGGKKGKILIICGPTASGKSKLALACAKLLRSEIISADALDVYRGLNIGTAKPTKSEMQEIRHHLIDVVSADSTFSVGDYKELARPIVNDLISKGKIPIICGGTGFYIDSILYDFSYGKSAANIPAREKYMRLAEETGKDAVFEILKSVDPLSAEKLHPNDLKRVVRALEIYESGVKKSDLTDERIPVYDYAAYCLDFERDELYRHIDMRVDNMLENGLVEEVQNLIDEGITLENQCMQGIGYKEIYSYLQGDCALADAVAAIKLNTRHYAKRQITFFKRLENLVWLKPDDENLLAERIVKDL
ncbi:MAG: tRNA (adenosine(37)-N6)-dimethylallyltransferase MiaA [Clostridia bacterium]|nr:tRNA (adenosine(37)-N6)-dimethylallyltransferase MiaA [Clostridia bacterium]